MNIEYCTRFVYDYFRRHPGVGVVLHRVGLSVARDLSRETHMTTNLMPLSIHFWLDCATSALGDAVWRL